METSNKVFINRNFNCSAAELFEWIIRPELLAQWFGPKHLSAGIVKTDVRIGGLYSIELKKSDTSSFFITGKYQEINAPHHLIFSLKYSLPDPPPESVVNITLTEIEEQKTELRLVQSFATIPNDMEGRTKAWEFMLGMLAEKLIRK